MKDENYLFGYFTKDTKVNIENEFSDDIVFARYINYMKKTLLHKKLDYNKHQDFLKCQEQYLKQEEWAVLSNKEDSSVHSIFILKEDYNKLNIAISKLTEKQRYVIINHYYYNQSLNKIAEKMKIEVNAVYQLKVRAILSLKRFMED